MIKIKQKSIIFVILLISILLFTLYLQNNTSNRNYLYQVQLNYKKTFDNYEIFFKKNLINFYELQSTYIKKDKNIISKVLLNNEYLKDIKIIYINNNKFNIYKKQLKKQKTFIDTIKKTKTFFYKLIVPIIKDKKVFGYIEYLIDYRIFLQSIKDFDGTSALVFNKENYMYFKEHITSSSIKTIINNFQDKDKLFFEFKSDFYVKKTMIIHDIFGKKIADSIFFLNISKEKQVYKDLIRKSIFTTIFLFIIASILVYYFFNYLIKKLQKNENELKDINKNLEHLVEYETSKRLKNEELLINQSRLALLGEMIGNIAHQWRQPLMQLSAILMYLDASSEKGKLTSEKLFIKVKDGNKIIDYMSKTIEDFRNYYKPEKQKEEFIVQESINSAMFIIGSSLKNANIKVGISGLKEDIKIISFKNEFSQALLNIITNAKDTLVERKIKNPKITIEIIKKENFIIISINDNANGIKKEFLNKVFEPYFTTKHKSQGTGIGLYMSKMIIENNMNGNISVENNSLGAKFIIKFGIKKE